MDSMRGIYLLIALCGGACEAVMVEDEFKIIDFDVGGGLGRR